MRVWDKPGTHAAQYANNDVLRVKAYNQSSIVDAWLQVQGNADPGATKGYWGYTVSKVHGDSGRLPRNAAIVNYGSSGGFIEVSGDGTNPPYIKVSTHSGAPWSPTDHLRIGNINGCFGLGSDEWGIAAGTDLSDATGRRLIFSDQRAIIDFSGEADCLIFDADGDTHLSAPTDDQIDVCIAGANDFTFTANSFDVLTDSHIAMADGTWLGGGAAAGRIVVNLTADPDRLQVTAADLQLPSGLGLMHEDGNTNGLFFRGNGTRYVPSTLVAGDAGAVTTRHGVVGEGDLPTTVVINERGELRSAAFTIGESHGLAGTLSVVDQASALYEAVTVL